jgi:serine/threonine-protein kinase
VRFGKYNLIAALGHGGMADVFLAVYSGQIADGFNKLIVLKRLRANLAEDPEFVAMLLDEARLAARLNHLNVVQTNEIGKVGNQYFIAMEYLDGQPMSRLLTRAKKKVEAPMPGHLELTIWCEVLSGLHYAHELQDYDGSPLNIVHRDVSPHNVFVTYAGQVKLVDFGIAKAAGVTAETREGIIKGKIAYMAPEQAMGLAIDRRADLFAVGIALWEALTGERMWKNVDELVIFQRLIAKEIPRSPRAKNPNVPEELDRIVQRALAPDVEERYSTAADFQSDLEKYLRAHNQYASARELGQYVADLFADKRAEVKAVIDDRLAKLKSRPNLPELEPGMSLPPMVGESQRNVASASETIVGALSPPEPKRRTGVWIAIAGVAAVLLVAMVGIASRNNPAGKTSATNATSTNTIAPGTKTNVQVVINVVPADARIRIDDGPALDNPYVATIPRDEGTHIVTIEAPGHRSRTVEVSYAADVRLEIALVKDASATPKATPPPGQYRPVPAPPTTPAKGNNGRPVRPIDSAITW